MTLFLALSLLLVDDPIVEEFDAATPEGWERIDSDAHPPYNTIEIVREQPGSGFLRMRSLGGSTSYRLSARRAWPVDPSKPYRLSVQARLSGTRRNTATLTLTWLNADGERIGELRSAPLSQAGGWTELSIDVARVPAGAAAAAPRLDFEGDDVRGDCDFDRLVFAPVWLLELRSSAVFSPAEHPRVTVSLAGAPAGAHGVTLALAGQRRSALLRIPSENRVDVDLPPPGPGAHELVASLDGTAIRRTLTLLVPNPWTSSGEAPAIPPAILAAAVRGPLTDAEGRPTAAWLAQKALNDVFEGAVPMPDPALFPAGVRSLAFRKKDSALLALWSEPGEVEVPVTLNDGAKLYPPLGAIRPLRPGERLRLGSMPVFIVGVDPLLLEMRLSLSSSDLPLQLNPTARTLRLYNPSRRLMRDVRVRIDGLPPGWRVTPQSFSVPQIAAESDLVEELQFTLPASETERVQELRFDVTFVREGKESSVRLSRVLRLTSVIAIDAAVADGAVAGSKKLTIRITNASDRPMTLALRARLPQLPEQNELLRNLAPGATSAPFTWLVKDLPLLDPAHVSAEIDVRESVGARARKVVSLR